ncbi:MAG: hypothetical protein KME47_10775 [Nodosilinea sp. WJT8-NPBG4]|jgi:hypothetical protein|nr:hypothetical protein [Nodosilinea sp. WJT8-NPBG4]
MALQTVTQALLATHSLRSFCISAFGKKVAKLSYIYLIPYLLLLVPLASAKFSNFPDVITNSLYISVVVQLKTT